MESPVLDAAVQAVVALASQHAFEMVALAVLPALAQQCLVNFQAPHLPEVTCCLGFGHQLVTVMQQHNGIAMSHTWLDIPHVGLPSIAQLQPLHNLINNVILMQRGCAALSQTDCSCLRSCITTVFLAHTVRVTTHEQLWCVQDSCEADTSNCQPPCKLLVRRPPASILVPYRC